MFHLCFFFGFLNFFSGITLYEPFLHQLFNVIYSIFPIFYFSIFDREYESDFFVKNPEYYIQGMKNENFNILFFYKFLIIGFVEGFILSLSAFITFYFNNKEGYNLNNLYSIGNVIFSGIIIIVNLKVLFNSKIIDIFLILLVLFSIISFYIGVILFSGEKIGFIFLHKYFLFHHYIIGDYTYVIKDIKYLLYILYIIGEVIIIDNISNNLFKLFEKKIENIYVNETKNNNLSYNENGYELDFISNSEKNEIE